MTMLSVPVPLSVRGRLVRYGALAAAAVLMAIALAALAILARTDTTRVTFLDVGQGDAILVTRGAHQVLIDGGADGRLLLERLAAQMPFWDRTIDVVVATHPDTDHIGAQIDVFGTYRVPVVVATASFGTSPAATVWHGALEASRARVLMADAGVVVRMAQGDEGAGVLRVLYPRTAADVAAAGDDTNAASVVLRLDTAGGSFLLTGDLPEERENLVATDPVTVLKVGHHGSKYSTGTALLARIRPRDAVVSVGASNRYGHPAPETLDRLAAAGATILRTDQDGTVTYVCRQFPTASCERTAVR